MNRRNHRQSKLRRLKKPLIITAVVLLVCIGVFAYINHSNNNASSDPTANKDPMTVVATPPTEQDKKAVEEHKDALVQQNKDGTTTPTPSTTSSGKKQVDVALVRANLNGGGVDVSGYVTGVIENGGKCTATLTQGSITKTGASTGFADASTTNCPSIHIAGAGNGWSVVLSYESTSSSGASNPGKVN